MTTTSPQLRDCTDVVAIARRSIVGVRVVASGGTGWVALGNGLVLTSHEAVGYQTEVTLEVDAARRVPGRVIWADVSRDLALILPTESLGLPPLLSRPDLPRTGEPVFALALVPGQPFRAASAFVSAVDRRVGAIRCFEIDAVNASAGGPIIDVNGRVLGIGGLDLPRGSRRRAAPPVATRFAPAIPIAALQRAFAAFDLMAAQFETRVPTYRCPGCGDPYVASVDRCLTCGQRLPHAWEPNASSSTPTFAAAERLVRDLLARLGAVAASVRVGPRTYRLLVPASAGSTTQMAEISLDLDEQGKVLRGKTPLVRVPAANQEPFYRFLLTLNDQAASGLRLTIEEDIVHLTFAEPTELLSDVDAAQLFEELVRSGERLRKALGEAFEAKAVVV
ncbi:MAG: serine protease [Byssovorax sp.]